MEIHLAITAHSHGLGLVIDFNNVHSSRGSVSSVNQTSRKPKAGSNPLIEKYTSPAEPETNTCQQKWKSALKIILVQMEQHTPGSWFAGETHASPHLTSAHFFFLCLSIWRHWNIAGSALTLFYQAKNLPDNVKIYLFIVLIFIWSWFCNFIKGGSGFFLTI